MTAEMLATAAGCSLLIAGILLSAHGRVGVALSVQGLGMATVCGVGLAALLGEASFGAEFRGDVAPAFGIDALSGYFLLVLTVVALPALGYAAATLGDGASERVLAGLTGAFLLAMTGFVIARDPVTLLAFWELMTLIPAAAILVYGPSAESRRSVFVYLAVTHVGGAGVWFAVLGLAESGALGGTPVTGGLQAALLVAALVGFSTKAGVMPLHVWLPRAHPAAPAHISALMSGVMIKLALYGLIRTVFEWAAPAPLWVGITLMAAGALSAVAGVLYALMQHELKRLLAFHSIENIGIIVLALGVAVTLRGRDETWSALAFAAALLHVLNHAVFKAALFLGAGAFSRAVGSLELDRLGGLARRMPVTALAFGTAAMAIAGLPPLNGFASEWLAMQSLIRLPVSADDGTALAGAVGLAALAAMAALAVLCFVKVIGLVLLGEPRRPECEDAEEAPKAIRVSMLWLAGLCVVLGPLAAVLVPILAELSPVGGEFGTSISIEAAGTGTFPGLGILIALVAVVAGLMWLRGARRAAPAPTWICGQPPARELAWTSAGFTKTLRLALSRVLRPEREVVVRAEGGVNQQLVYRAEVPHLFDTRMYRPVATWSLRVAARVRRLQSGNLRSYIVYLFGLVLVLLAFARTGWIS